MRHPILAARRRWAWSDERSAKTIGDLCCGDARHGRLLSLNQIDHNPNERRPPRWFWWPIIAIFAVLWVFTITGGSLGWGDMALAFTTGGLLGLWVMEKTGGEFLSSPRGPTKRR